MRKSLTDINKELENLAKKFEELVGKTAESCQETIDDYIYTEQQETAWLDSELQSRQNFTKRIATPLPTKRRRRVTWRNNIYIEVLPRVTNIAYAR